MDEKMIKEFVDKAMNSNLVNIYDIFQNYNNEDNLTQYKLMTAYRVISFWRSYQKRMISKSDFEVSLRNYLLVFNTTIELNGFEISKDNVFGLSQADGIISANYYLPEYANKEFVQKVFMNGVKYEEQKNRYILATNPFVRKLTGFKEYKSIEQKLSVIGALKVPKGYACMVSMSTGAGKSLITQTVSYQESEGLSIIIVPTISLMLDQQKNAKRILKKNNTDEIFYYSSGAALEPIINAIETRKARMLFLSPEALLKNVRLKEVIEKANSTGYLKNLIIDEAHIIVEWGTSFRIDFQCLDSFRKVLMKENSDLRTYLLSATYSKETAKQLKKFYSVDQKWIELRCDKLRTELHFDVISAASKKDKYWKMYELINVLPRPMIVYVKSPDEAEYIKKVLVNKGFSNIHTFTGKTGDSARDKLINDWASNEFDIMIATCAFGVGVDKKDVRTVLHLYIPENPNKYYQEAGRGGRDGLPCLSVILYDQDDIASARGMTQKVLKVDKIIGRWFSMLNSSKAARNADEIIIDTSVKPKYNETDTYMDFFDASDIDISWNVYVILLLRRNGLIDINDVFYKNGLYLFSLKILDRVLLDESIEMEELISKVRENEVNFVSKEFKLIERAIKLTGKECWSEMFTEEYDLTDEYCAGCNYHSKVIDGKSNDFPLRRGVKHNFSMIPDSIRKFSENSKNVVVQYENDINIILNSLSKQSIEIIVVPDDMIIDYDQLSITSSCSLNIMNYSEFFLHLDKGLYYIGGAAVIVYDAQNRYNARMINAVSNNIFNEENSCFIHLVEKDFKVDKYGKYFSELIDAPFKSDYLLDRK